ncbi:MAG: histidine kinase dimerization/phospho-acceptor domain-containing protein [Patescibacteria group bacterium]
MVTSIAQPQEKTEPITPRQFIGEAAHKIKGPLTTIQLYTEALSTGTVGALTPEQKDYVNEIHNASTRLIATLKELEANTHLS